MAKRTEDLLRFCTPASWWGEKWREGLFSGNGNKGVNVYGGAVEESILINDSRLFWHGRTNVVPDISMKVKDLRKKIDVGDYLGGQKVLPDALASKNFHPQAEYSLPVCRLNVHFDHNGFISNFERSINMSSGEICVKYAVAGTKYQRSVFVSRESGLIVYSITKQGAGTIDATLHFGVMHKLNSNTPEGECIEPDGVEISAEKQFLNFSAINDDDGTNFGAVARVVVNGGSFRTDGKNLHVSMASSVLILVDTFVASNHEREWPKLATKLSAIKDGYDKMLKSHFALHNKLYSSVSVDLSEDDNFVEDLLLDARTGNTSAELVEKLYKYARYLFICGSSAERVFSPIGLWNGSYRPYKSFVNLGGEMQTSYLFTLQGGLTVDLEQSFEQFEKCINDYQNNALRLLGLQQGILLPVISAPNTGRLGSDDLFAVYFTGSAGWLCNLYYRYAVQTQNTKFIKQRLLPFMKEVALFYQEFFTESSDGTLVASPSILPIRIGADIVSDRPMVAKNSALDFAIARDFFNNYVEALKNAGTTKELAKWEEFAKKIPQNQTSGEGILKEFLNASISVDYSGISNGTLYPSYFSDEVNFLSNEETINQYEKTADKKLAKSDLQNGYNLAVLSSVYARLGDTYKTKLCLSNAVRGCVMGNLAFADQDWRGMGICGHDLWTPVQLQTNMVVANTIQQMLMYSNQKVIRLLPCVPEDWKNVSVENMPSCSGVEVTLSLCVEKETLSVSLISKKAVEFDLYLPQNVKKIVKTNFANAKLQSAGNTKCIKSLALEANKALVMNFKYAK